MIINEMVKRLAMNKRMLFNRDLLSMVNNDKKKSPKTRIWK